MELEMENMLDTNTNFQNETLGKNTKLEENIKALKEQIEPDDEMEQLVTLMAGKNRSYSRTAQGAIPKNSTKRFWKFVDWFVRQRKNTKIMLKVTLQMGTGCETNVTSKQTPSQI